MHIDARVQQPTHHNSFQQMVPCRAISCQAAPRDTTPRRATSCHATLRHESLPNARRACTHPRAHAAPQIFFDSAMFVRLPELFNPPTNCQPLPEDASALNHHHAAAHMARRCLSSKRV